jgi:hypothetical protein
LKIAEKNPKRALAPKKTKNSLLVIGTGFFEDFIRSSTKRFLKMLPNGAFLDLFLVIYLLLVTCYLR